ncbi:heat shock 70 kDa protein 15-like protein [Tanacetum coccineum]
MQDTKACNVKRGIGEVKVCVASAKDYGPRESQEIGWPMVNKIQIIHAWNAKGREHNLCSRQGERMPIADRIVEFCDAASLCHGEYLFKLSTLPWAALSIGGFGGVGVSPAMRLWQRRKQAANKKKQLSRNAQFELNICGSQMLPGQKRAGAEVLGIAQDPVASKNVEAYALDVRPATRAIREPRVVVQTTSEVVILDDGHRRRNDSFLLNHRKPRRAMNTSECVSKGCALECAIPSPNFKVTDFQICDFLIEQPGTVASTSLDKNCESMGYSKWPLQSSNIMELRLIYVFDFILDEEDDENVNNETCLVAHASSEK